MRLAEGDMDRATIYGDDPAAQAVLFAEAGAMHLHVVDLDGATVRMRSESRPLVRVVASVFDRYLDKSEAAETPRHAIAV